MPAKSTQQRTKRALRTGTAGAIKITDRTKVSGKSAHALKKSSTNIGLAAPTKRGVSARAAPGEGKTATGKRLPLPEGGASSSNPRRTRPSEAAATLRRGKPRTGKRG